MQSKSVLFSFKDCLLVQHVNMICICKHFPKIQDLRPIIHYEYDILLHTED